MPVLLLPATRTTPLVWFDASTGTGKIAGSSLPVNASELYARMTEWLDAELPTLNVPMMWRFRLEYFNTSSMRELYQLMKRIKAHMDLGHPHAIEWVVEEGDDLMQEAGENFMELLDLPLTFRYMSEDEVTLENAALAGALKHRTA